MLQAPEDPDPVRRDNVVMIDTKDGKEKVNPEVLMDEDAELETILSLQTKRQEVYRKYAKVCTELKLLYVAITRPKQLLIIYDQDP